MRPTRNNVSGVESFDHSQIVELSEYHAARKALNDLVHAINKLENDGRLKGGQRWWLKTVEMMAASLAYADASGHRRAGSAKECPQGYEMTWPYRTVVNGASLKCWYQCPECGARWTCGYAVNIAEYS